MKKWWRILASVLVALVFSLGIGSPVLAGTTTDVVVTATPSYLSIGATPGSYNFGAVDTSTNYSTTNGYFTVGNNSSVTCNVTIGVTSANWSGGDGWGHSETATAGDSIAGLVSSNNTGAFNVIVKQAAPHNQIYPNLPATPQTFTFELKLVAPTSFTDGTQKTQTVRLTAARST
jgi:hypothetical protein